MSKSIGKREHLHHIKNPIKNQHYFSESDLCHLLTVHKDSSQNPLIFINENNGAPNSAGPTQNDDLPLCRVSNNDQEDYNRSSSTNSSILILVSIKQSNDRNFYQPHVPVAQIMCITFLDIFYKSVRKHFSCPICNEPLQKPQMLPACGHIFCDTCLTFWFAGNAPHSCPICRYSTHNNNRGETFIYSVESFMKSVGHLEKFFQTVKLIPKEHRSEALLLCLQLPNDKRNSKLLDSLSFSYPRLASKSLSSIQKKWSFEQLLDSLRFVQLQATNKYLSSLSSCPTLIQNFQKLLLDIVLMVCPFYPTFSRLYRIIRTLFNGRRQLRFVLPTVDNLCVFLVGLALAIVIFSLFSFLLQLNPPRFRGCMRFISHLIIVFLVNDYVNAL